MESPLRKMIQAHPQAYPRSLNHRHPQERGPDTAIDPQPCVSPFDGWTMGVRLVRRRPQVERRVLGFIRGNFEETVSDPRVRKVCGYACAGSFAVLRTRARMAGLLIQAPEALYACDDELRLLGWLAHAQRVAVTQVAYPSDPTLHSAIVECAWVIKDLGLGLLSAATIYSGIMHDRPAGA